MLIACPECERQVSDRAPACPGCGFPIAQAVAEQRAAQERLDERSSREPVGDTDCVACVARGFVTFEETREDGQPYTLFSWCEICEHSGRVALCRSAAGYWAIRRTRLEDFLAGRLDAEEHDAVVIGDSPPASRYPRP